MNRNNNCLTLEFLVEFAKAAEPGEWDHETCRNQLKALWTAYCIVNRYDVDTAGYDRDLNQLWNAVISTMDIAGSSHIFADYGCFDDYMCEDLA